MASDIERLRAANGAFFEKVDRAMRSLFGAARARNELHFALSLRPEYRGFRDAGWSSADEAHVAFSDYLGFLQQGDPSRLKVRVMLGFYSHIAEASGFYEIPKNMLRVAEGQRYNTDPFRHLVDSHRTTGTRIAPNANKVLRDLAGHASTLGHQELAEVFRDAFDPEVRNAYSHADYVVWTDSVRIGLRRGPLRAVSFDEFTALFEKGINFFEITRRLVDECISSYNPPRVIRSQLANEPEHECTIAYDPERRTISISGSVSG